MIGIINIRKSTIKNCNKIDGTGMMTRAKFGSKARVWRLAPGYVIGKIF